MIAADVAAAVAVYWRSQHSDTDLECGSFFQMQKCYVNKLRGELSRVVTMKCEFQLSGCLNRE